jgi:hypothetical protein
MQHCSHRHRLRPHLSSGNCRVSSRGTSQSLGCCSSSSSSWGSQAGTSTHMAQVLVHMMALMAVSYMARKGVAVCLKAVMCGIMGLVVARSVATFRTGRHSLCVAGRWCLVCIPAVVVPDQQRVAGNLVLLVLARSLHQLVLHTVLQPCKCPYRTCVYVRVYTCVSL